MRIIDWKVLKTMVPWSRQHLARLERAGKFPQRVQIGNNRVGWVLEEVTNHLEHLASLRERPIDTP